MDSKVRRAHPLDGTDRGARIPDQSGGILAGEQEGERHLAIAGDGQSSSTLARSPRRAASNNSSAASRGPRSSSSIEAALKYFLFGDSKQPIPGSFRIYNKVGQAYGYLLDDAYVVDLDEGVEF